MCVAAFSFVPLSHASPAPQYLYTQNNLDELWALADWVGDGRLLGSRREFNRCVGDRIVASRDRHATVEERHDGRVATEQVRRERTGRGLSCSLGWQWGRRGCNGS